MMHLVIGLRIFEMAISRFSTIFMIFETNLIISFVSSRCVTTKVSLVECDSVLLLTDGYFNESIENIQDVKRLFINNNGSRLLVHYSAFRYFINLKELVIQNSQTRRIFRGAFWDLPVECISIKQNGMEEILPGAFRNLSSLQNLGVSYNCLRGIPRGVFGNLPALESLALSYNEISSIDNYALENLPRLRELQLDNNNINAISIHNIVSHPEQLMILWLHKNSLTFVTNFMLQRLTKLKLLNLGFNMISMIEVNSFEQTPELRTLVLTHNQLKELDSNIFPSKGLNHLDKLYLDNNELMFLSSSFFLRLNNLMEITLVGNPWACTCLDVINRILMENSIEEKCQGLYVSGKRPICVNSDVLNKVCTYRYDCEMSAIYMNHRKQFPVHEDNSNCFG